MVNKGHFYKKKGHYDPFWQKKGSKVGQNCK